MSRRTFLGMPIFAMLSEPIGVAVLQPYEKSPVSVAAYNRLRGSAA